jgi:hypothetical protein
MMRFLAPDKNLAVGGGTVYSVIGDISVSSEMNGYKWGNGVSVSHRCVEHNVMSRFNDAVSMDNIYVDNDVFIAGNLSINAASHPSDRTGVIVIGNTCIEFGRASITTGATGTSGIYTGTLAVTFTKKFKNVPAILTSWGGRYNDMNATGASDTTKSGATIWGKTTTATATRTVQWVAIGAIE